MLTVRLWRRQLLHQGAVRQALSAVLPHVSQPPACYYIHAATALAHATTVTVLTIFSDPAAVAFVRNSPPDVLKPVGAEMNTLTLIEELGVVDLSLVNVRRWNASK